MTGVARVGSMPAKPRAAAGQPRWSRDRKVSSETVLTPRPLSARAAGPLQGRLRVPGDKSISHRALILGALASGTTQITGLLEAEDVLNTAQALRALGVPIEKNGAQWQLKGRGVGGLRAPDGPLAFGNSGTGTRLMLGVIAGHDLRARLTGDASLSKRPMARVLDSLKQMGLEVEGGRDRLPLEVRGSSSLVPITYELPVPSAQVKSAILFAGLSAAGTTTVIESEPTRDHTERLLKFFGAQVRTAGKAGKLHITVEGDAELEGRDVAVPGDPSSAAFLTAAALIVPGSGVTIEGVLVNPTRIGFYLTLQEMGADVALLDPREEGGEPVADVRVRASKLEGVGVPAKRAPSMIDEYPALAIVAAFARGVTRMEGLAELKLKESDRLAATVAGLLANGIAARAEGDTLIVEGAERVPGGGTVATHLDHRIAMAFLTLSSCNRAAGDGRRHHDGGDELSRVPRADGKPRRNFWHGGGAMIIAIDGPAASGKGTLAKRIAQLWDLPCLDTGLLYRAVARDVAARGFKLADAWAALAVARSLDPASLEDPGLRTPGAGEAASIVASMPAVRAALLDYQRAFAARPGGAVLDGRDIGTVVCPTADAKVYVTARPEVRAWRRFAERQDQGMSVIYDVVLADIERRDARDAGRESSPMRPAPDADLLETSDLDIEAAFEAAVGLIKRKIGR